MIAKLSVSACRSLMAGLLLVAATSVWCAEQLPPSREPLTPDHVGAEPRLTRMLLEARELAARGAYETALRNYLHVFVYSRSVARLAALRLSLLPAEIVAMGAVYPPALDALRAEIRIRAGLILTGVAGSDEILEFIALNRALEQPQRILELYDQLKSMGERMRDMRLLMRDLIWEEQLEAKRYGEVGDRILRIARRMAQRIAEYEIAEEFRAPDEKITDAYRDAERAHIIADTLNGIDALLVTNHQTAAHQLAKRLTAFDATATTFIALVGLAVKNKETELAKSLVGDAEKSLSAEDGAKLRAKFPR